MKDQKEIPYESRKYKLTLWIFIASVVICLVPPTISSFVFKMAPLTILSGAEWVSLISVLCGFYFGANVWQKKIIKDGEISISKDNAQMSKDSAQISADNAQISKDSAQVSADNAQISEDKTQMSKDNVEISRIQQTLPSPPPNPAI